MFSESLLISKCLFQDDAIPEKNALFRAIANKLRKPTILQLNIKDLTASQLNVLHYLASQFVAVFILLRETHCTNAKKLVFPSFQLAAYSLSRKHSLATFVHKRLRYTLLKQFPPTLEI